MAIYRGPGGPGDAIADADSEAALVSTLVTQAQTAATSASNSATTASTAATTAQGHAASAASSASGASSSASSASSSASSASSSASSASTSATNASTSATNAASSATSASVSASNAATSETNAANSASTASTAATNAANSASNASTSASNAATSASTASTAATNASNSATAAATSATNASNSATTASTAATNASNSATAASTSASNAATSATNASNSASSASTSATNASNSASAASTSASNAATSETNAASSATAAANSYDAFDDRYLGSKASPPSVDNDGNALLTGALYWNTGNNQLYVWDGSAWDAAAFNTSGALLTTDIGVTVQGYDAGLQSISGLTTVADRMIYTTASDVYAVTTLTAAGRAILDDADAAAQRTTLGLAIGTNVQAYDAGLQSIAGLTTVADRMIYTTASDTYAVTTLTAAGRAILDDANAAEQRTTLGLTIGTNVQAYDAGLQSISGLTTAADKMIYTTASDTYAVADLTAAGRALLDDANAAAQRTTLGATTVGSNLFTLINPGAITFPRFNADNTVSSLSATDFRTAIGAGTGNGTVTGVTATSPVASSGGTAPVISLSSAYGDTLNPYASKTANFFLAAPNGTSGTPSFRAIVAADIPTLNQNTTGTASNVTGTVAIANGGTGATTAPNARTNLGATTLGSNIFTITNPSAITFPRFNADNTISSLSASDFRTAIGAGTGNGTVTSVGGTGTVNGITLTGTVTSSGSLTLGGTLSGVNLTTQVTGTLPLANGGSGQTTAQTAMNAFAGAVTSGSYLRGNGTNVLMSTIQAADVPTLNQNTTGSAATLTTARTIQTNLASTSAASFNGSANITPGVTGTLPVGNGGTGGTTFTANNVLLGNGTSAFQSVAPGTNGNVLTSNGTTWVSSAPTGGTGITMGKAIAAAIVFG